METNPTSVAFETALAAAGAISLVLAVLALVRDRRSPVHRLFAAGMAALSAEEILRLLSARAPALDDVLEWEGLGRVAGAAVPGLWLLFSLSYGRAGFRAILRAWRWRAGAVFAVPLAAGLLPEAWFYRDAEAAVSPLGWTLPLGRSGYAFHVALLLGYVLVVFNLERTLRAAAGSMRWRVKFVVLGLGGFFAIRIYAISQSLLFSTVDPRLRLLEAGVLLVSECLLLFALVRTRLAEADVYIAPSAIFQSLTLSLIGLYLIAVGALPVVLRWAGNQGQLLVGSFAVFLALLLLAVFLLSERLRHRARRSLNRAFGRPQYDYRRAWSVFTERTASVPDSRALCSAVCRMVSETLAVPAVSVWLLDESRGRLSLGGSTEISDARSRELMAGARDDGERLLRGMREAARTVDLAGDTGRAREELGQISPAFRDEARLRYAVGWRSGRELLGIMTLGEGLGDDALAAEEFDLLETIADQAAARLLSLELGARLLRAHEMEAFHSVSAFFLHDLKNLASRLSVSMQNLPRHYHDPAFRDDLLGVISRSVEKINSLCSRLATLTRSLDLEPADVDLNEAVRETLAGLDAGLRARVGLDLGELPAVVADAEQLHKVLLNFLLNADAAVGQAAAGEVKVRTGSRAGFALVEVADNGCGMSAEFMENELFKPFRTTKSDGLGIGLYHSRKIAEAHGGRIEVESEPGRGSTFRLLLPLATTLAGRAAGRA